MNREEIIEANTLIAEFDGYERTGHNHPFQPDKGPTYRKEGVAGEYWGERFNYHSSWNELMPVVEKIENIGSTSVNFHKTGCMIQPVVYDIKTDSLKWHDPITRFAKTKIEAVWLAVVEFINWWNSQQPSAAVTKL